MEGLSVLIARNLPVLSCVHHRQYLSPMVLYSVGSHFDWVRPSRLSIRLSVTCSCVSCRGMVMGISPTATSEECLSIMSSCGTSICVVQDMEQFEKVFEVGPK